MDCQKHMCGFTEPILWIQLVAEGSSSKQRGLVIKTLRARHFSKIKGKEEFNERRVSVQSKEIASSLRGEDEFYEGKGPAQ